MDVRFEERPAMTIVGLVSCGGAVADIDIAMLWRSFERQVEQIRHMLPEKSYELHIEDHAGTGQHVCLAGVEVSALDEMPVEMLAKVIPGGQYAVFTHCFRDGGFEAAFRNVYSWLEKSGFVAAYPFDIQCYDHRFLGPHNPDSILDILVPVQSAN